MESDDSVRSHVGGKVLSVERILSFRMDQGPLSLGAVAEFLSIKRDLDVAFWSQARK